MYLINNTLSSSLPFRLHLEDGRTRTSLHEMSDAQLAELGIYPCDEVKPPLEWTQHHGSPVIEVVDGRATATYPVLDYSADEVAGILEAAKERKRSEIAAARWEAETAGIDVNGFTVRTDRESQALLTGAFVSITSGLVPDVEWKLKAGWMTVEAADIAVVAAAVAAHVRKTFAVERAVWEQIEALANEDIEGFDVLAAWAAAWAAAG